MCTNSCLRAGKLFVHKDDVPEIPLMTGEQYERKKLCERVLRSERETRERCEEWERRGCKGLLEPEKLSPK